MANHPQTKASMKVSNHILLKGIKKKVDKEELIRKKKGAHQIVIVTLTI